MTAGRRPRSSTRRSRSTSGWRERGAGDCASSVRPPPARGRWAHIHVTGVPGRWGSGANDIRSFDWGVTRHRAFDRGVTTQAESLSCRAPPRTGRVDLLGCPRRRDGRRIRGPGERACPQDRWAPSPQAEAQGAQGREARSPEGRPGAGGATGPCTAGCVRGRGPRACAGQRRSARGGDPLPGQPGAGGRRDRAGPSGRGDERRREGALGGDGRGELSGADQPGARQSCGAVDAVGLRPSGCGGRHLGERGRGDGDGEHATRDDRGLDECSVVAGVILSATYIDTGIGVVAAAPAITGSGPGATYTEDFGTTS